MKNSLITLAAVTLLGFSSTAFAARGGNDPCDPRKPALPAPTNLDASSTTSSLDASWDAVTDATKYSIEVTAHYADAPSVTFTFTSFDTSESIPLEELATELCVEDVCGWVDAIAADVRVKALNPPKKGKDDAQCNPFTATCTIDICGDGIDGDDDGSTDEDCDADGDGFVTGSEGTGCSLGGDCDDSNGAINPDATEVCDDEADNDCDGDTDCDDGDCEGAEACEETNDCGGYIFGDVAAGDGIPIDTIYGGDMTYLLSCEDCSVDECVLYCTCLTAAEVPNETSIDLTSGECSAEVLEVLENNDGFLECEQD